MDCKGEVSGFKGELDDKYTDNSKSSPSTKETINGARRTDTKQ